MLSTTPDISSSRIARITLCGEFDLFRKEELAATLRQAEGAAVVVLDLAETTFVDATALSSLLVLRKKLRESGGSVHVIGARPHIRKLFAITGIDKVFEIHDQAAPLLALEFGLRA